ncbi:hypothetical protein SGPA1_41250 [Streptomyces misionensis JCM 4497]
MLRTRLRNVPGLRPGQPGITVHEAAAASGIPSVAVGAMGPEGLAGEPPNAQAARGDTDTAVMLCTTSGPARVRH